MAPSGYRSRTSTAGRNMAGARALWRATGMQDADFEKPIIAIANSFTQFVPGHVHLHDVGQRVKKVIDAAGGWGVEFNTIAVDDGIAMGHGGMLYSLPSRDLIADSVEYMVNAHCADALVCISNCDKITPGMLMAAMRLNIPTIFVSGGPMEAGKIAGTHDRDGKPLDPQARPDRPDDRRERRQRQRRRARRDGALGLPDLRLVLGHVHRQQHELPERGARPGAARQRHAARDPRARAGSCSRRAGRAHRRDGQALLRRRRRSRAAAQHRHVRGVRERDGARHRDGRLDQHRAAPPRDRARGGRRVHDGATSTGCRARCRTSARSRPRRTTTSRTCTAPAASSPSWASSTAPA